MKSLYGAALATFLLWLQAAPAVAECTSPKCPDAAAIERRARPSRRPAAARAPARRTASTSSA